LTGALRAQPVGRLVEPCESRSHSVEDAKDAASVRQPDFVGTTNPSELLVFKVPERGTNLDLVVFQHGGSRVGHRTYLLRLVVISDRDSQVAPRPACHRWWRRSDRVVAA